MLWGDLIPGKISDFWTSVDWEGEIAVLIPPEITFTQLIAGPTN